MIYITTIISIIIPVIRIINTTIRIIKALFSAAATLIVIDFFIKIN